MIKVSEVYQIQGTPAKVNDFVIGDKWFPELESIDNSIGFDLMTKIDTEARLTLRQLVDENYDGDRYAAMYSLWFDGKPFMFVQEAGRGGRDHFYRGVTDVARYEATTSYLRSFMGSQLYDGDVVDPESLVYPESLFSFYSNDFGSKLGYPPEVVTPGFLLINATSVLPGEADGRYVVIHRNEVDDEPLPDVSPYLRRMDVVLRLVRELTEEDHARNVRLKDDVLEVCSQKRYYLFELCENPKDSKPLSV